MGVETLLPIGVSLLSSAAQSGAASSAAGTTAAATDRATAENARQFDRNVGIEQQRYDQNRSDRQPYMASGRTALAQYLREMGLPGVTSRRAGGRASGTSVGGSQASGEQLRAQLLGQYTQSTPGAMIPQDAYDPVSLNYRARGLDRYANTNTVDEAGLSAAIERLAAQQGGAAGQSGGYGDLPDMEDIQTTAPQTIDPTQDPGYQFGLRQGQQGIDRRIAAGGGRVSGASLKAAGEYATNYATTGYNAAYQRGQDRLSRLAAIAGYGTTPASGSLGQQPNNGNAALISSQGNASAAGQLAQGNIWGNAANQLGAQLGRSQPTVNNGFGTGPQFGNQDYGQYF